MAKKKVVARKKIPIAIFYDIGPTCEECDYLDLDMCNLFYTQDPYLKKHKDGKFKRCKQCIRAETDYYDWE